MKLGLSLAALVAHLALGAPAAAEVVVVRAGTAHLVEEGTVLEGGVTLVIEDGVIRAIGDDSLVVPANASVVDYGPDAVIVPGLVAADSGFSGGRASDRTADPSLRALDGFDFYSHNTSTLAEGITSVYLRPAVGRLIAGRGAVVKLAGESGGQRVLREPATIDGAIHRAARRTPGYWRPPIPATVDVGLGFAQPQLPRTTMGAILALEELIGAAKGGVDLEIYGPGATLELAELMASGARWRLAVEKENEIRALLDLAQREDLDLILDEAPEAAGLAAEIAAADVGVIFDVEFVPERQGNAYGKDEDDRWPDYSVPAALDAAGVSVAISTSGATRNLRFAAGLASRGGLDPATALRAITLTPAELLGVDSRVGSLRAGKDADLLVLNGPPMAAGSSVLATWIDGEAVWSSADGSGASDHALVVEVEELHVGDGTVLSPGQILIKGGKIASVGQRVSHPAGATIVRGRAAMPGVIDAMGFLGLGSARSAPNPDFDLRRIVAPGDELDRRVAAEGVTTVLMTPRSQNSSGAPILAYKPAGTELDRQVVAAPAALRLGWSESNRFRSGEAVEKLLEKVVEYQAEWEEYEAAIAAWVPEPEPAKDDEDDDDEDEDDEDEEEDDEDEDEEENPELIGIWEATIERPPLVGEFSLRLQVKHEEGRATGYLRCEALSDELIAMTGRYEDEELMLQGLGTRGGVTLNAEVDEEEMEGTLGIAGEELEFEAERTSIEYPEAKRSERRRVTEERVREPRGKPRKPKVDDKLEPLRRALAGETAVLVDVSRDDDIVACVEAFAAVGIKPVLVGADDAHRVIEEIHGRVAGVLLDQEILEWTPKEGTRHRYAELQDAGIPVAFRSNAEEGAIDLPVIAAYAVSVGMGADGALRALTSDAAEMFRIAHRVGRLEAGMDADVLLLDGPPLEPSTSVLRTWVNGKEIRP